MKHMNLENRDNFKMKNEVLLLLSRSYNKGIRKNKNGKFVKSNTSGIRL